MSAAPRITRLVTANSLLLAVVLVAVGLLAFGGAWTTYTDVPTERVSEEVNQQTVGTQLDTSAVVTGNTTLYEQGEVLRNKPVYFVLASPNLTLKLTTTVPQGVQSTVTHEITLEFRATRDGEEFWNLTRPVLSERTGSASGEFSSQATLNISAVRSTVDARRTEISEVGVLQTNLLVNVSYQTNRYSGDFVESTSVVFTETAYWLAGDIANSRSHSETRTRVVRGERDLVTPFGLAAVGIVALAAAGGVLVLRQRVDPLELETQLYRSQYEEWISDGEFPTGTNKKYVRINSLEDLVDIAIDSNKRVLYDEDFDLYAVIDADIIYYFSTDPESVDSWLDV